MDVDTEKDPLLPKTTGGGGDETGDMIEMEKFNKTSTSRAQYDPKDIPGLSSRGKHAET